MIFFIAEEDSRIIPAMSEEAFELDASECNSINFLEHVQVSSSQPSPRPQLAFFTFFAEIYYLLNFFMLPRMGSINKWCSGITNNRNWKSAVVAYNQVH